MSAERIPVASTTEKKQNPSSLPFLELILKSVEDLNYGSVEIIVHDSKVVQIEIKEKVRFS